MMFRNFILSMAPVHLTCLRAKLVVLSPILLSTDTSIPSDSDFIACAIQIHTPIGMILYMQRVNGEPNIREVIV
jgi:hypothetical protein